MEDGRQFDEYHTLLCFLGQTETHCVGKEGKEGWMKEGGGWEGGREGGREGGKVEWMEEGGREGGREGGKRGMDGGSREGRMRGGREREGDSEYICGEKGEGVTCSPCSPASYLFSPSSVSTAT